MKTGKTSYIEVTKQSQAKLAKTFKCSPKLVYLSLTYQRDSEKARKIRYSAISQYGGKAMAHCPECETMHNVTEEGRALMVQYFDNGVKLEADKCTGEVILFDRKGAELGRWQDVNLPKLSEIQIYAESL
ncbi:MAG: hypothetical protein J1E97_07955 [Muribaculaceae bacterium]|nr:hypothetical protein [Muribaculaceae bacterium]